MSPEFVSCDICGKNDVKILFTGRDMHLGLPGKFNLCECRKCGLVYLNPRPTKSEMLKYYPERDYDAWQPVCCKPICSSFDSNVKKTLRSVWNAYIQSMKGTDPWSLGGMTKGKVLDVGCGTGGYLRTLKNDGWETRGVDISPVATKHARKLGLNVFTGELHEAKFPDRYFDVIVMRHVLEHLHNPSDVLKEVHRILKDDGFLQVEVPNFGGMGAKIFKKYWHLLHIPRHLYHFSLPTLKLLLEKSGFLMVKVNYGADPIGVTGSLNLLTKKRATSFWGHFIVVGILFPLSSIAARLNLGASITVRARKMRVHNENYS